MKVSLVLFDEIEKASVLLGGTITFFGEFLLEAKYLHSLVKKVKAPATFVLHVRDFIETGIRKKYIQKDNQDVLWIEEHMKRIP